MGKKLESTVIESKCIMSMAGRAGGGTGHTLEREKTRIGSSGRQTAGESEEDTVALMAEKAFFKEAWCTGERKLGRGGNRIGDCLSGRRSGGAKGRKAICQTTAMGERGNPNALIARHENRNSIYRPVAGGRILGGNFL